MGYKSGFQFIRTYPHKFVSLAGKKIILLWALESAGVLWNIHGIKNNSELLNLLLKISQGYYFCMILLMIATLFKTRKMDNFSIFLLLILVFWTVIHCLFIAADRFHFPLIPIIAIYAGKSLLQFYQHNKPINH